MLNHSGFHEEHPEDHLRTFLDNSMQFPRRFYTCGLKVSLVDYLLQIHVVEVLLGKVYDKLYKYDKE